MDKARYWTVVALAIAVGAAGAAIAGALGAGALLAALAGAASGLLIAGALSGVARTPEAAPLSEASGIATASPAVPPDEPAVLDRLPLALILLDAGGRVRMANAAAVALFGPVKLDEPLTAIVRARALTELVAGTGPDTPPATVEFKHMRARGERVLLAHVCPVGGRDTDAAMMILIEDHTRFARIEQMRKDFIANASHELKTPLASIAGFIETLQGAAREDPAAAERFLPIMAAQADRMKRLITDLTSLSRIEMEAHLRPTGTVDMGALARETALAMSPLAGEVGIEIRVELPERGPAVTGDRDQLSQLLVNLLDNAIKYGSGPEPIRVHAAPPEPGRAAMAGISVTDHGPGIAREHIPRLTERFYRVSDPARKAKAGTGLGLSIVKHVLNRHRGELAIRSAPGAGATFTAWLPLPVDSGAIANAVDSGPESQVREEINQ